MLRKWISYLCLSWNFDLLIERRNVFDFLVWNAQTIIFALRKARSQFLRDEQANAVSSRAI